MNPYEPFTPPLGRPPSRSPLPPEPRPADTAAGPAEYGELLVSVRGERVRDEPASAFALRGARLFDVFFALFLVCQAEILADPGPVPRLRVFLTAAAAVTALYGALIRFTRLTPGAFVWGLRRQDSRGRPAATFGAWIRLRWRASRGQNGALFAAALTAACVGAGAIALERKWEATPILETADFAPLDPWIPDNADRSPGTAAPAAAGDWSLNAFYYSLGAWPARYGGRPVLYSLPYEKGPPAHFVGHVVARWETPDVKVVFEGPRTPIENPRPGSAARALKDCLLPGWQANPFGCLGARAAALSRHYREMSAAVGPAGVEWELGWFEIPNAAVPARDMPQGVRITARGPRFIQERFIFITPEGAHQAFILERPVGPRGELARSAFEKAVRSQRVSGDLNPGRAWADRGLASVRLAESGQPTRAELAAAQTLLISKITVDPASFEAFFHLGGTASRMAPRSRATEEDREWLSVAKPLVASAYKFARDLAPEDPRTAQLRGLWLDLKD